MSSVFDAPTTEQSTADQVNGSENSNEQNTTEDWVSEVVKMKGEQWSDPQVLAKGYANAQRVIEEYKAKEAKFAEQDYAKNLLEQLQSKNTQAPEAAPDTSAPTQDSTEIKDTTSLSPEDIESLLETKLAVRQNKERVEKTLRDKFGDSANSVVHNRAKELGFSIEEMVGLSETKPDAFLRLIGEPEQAQTNSSIGSSVNTASQGFNKGKERDFAYYQRIRRENPAQYEKLQGQMYQDAVRLGQAFYQ